MRKNEMQTNGRGGTNKQSGKLKYAIFHQFYTVINSNSFGTVRLSNVILFLHDLFL